MATSCEFITAEASTKSWFRSRGLINEYLKITNLGKFRTENTKWSNNAKDVHGVEGRLFHERQMLDHIQAVPNTEMFKKIDNAKGIYYQVDESSVQSVLKSVDILQSERANQIFYKGKKAGWNIDKILQELQIPKEQKQLMLGEMGRELMNSMTQNINLFLIMDLLK